MLVSACLFVVGVALAQSAPVLPDPVWCALLPIAVWLIVVRIRASPLLAVLVGYLWAVFLAHIQMGTSLADTEQGRDVEIIGIVRGLTEINALRARFDFDIADALGAPISGRVRLSWYRARSAPAPGSVWRLIVRLRPPRGWRNPGGADYEGWLFAHRIVATGYVKSGRPIGVAPAWSLARIDAVRSDLARSIRSALDGYANEGLVRALAIGDRSGVSSDQWQTLRVTGTAHLMAISGLHIGMAAATAYWISLRAWVCIPRAALWIAAPQVAAVVGLLTAFGYALLAGLALPTQRAVLMLAVVFAARLSRRRVLSSHGLALALIIVLIVDPHSVRAPGFWLSFVAVAAIVLAIATRPKAQGVRPLVDKLRALGMVQIAVTVGLTPITLSVFTEQSLLSPLVNVLIIPLVGMFVVPVILLGLLVGMVVPGVAAGLFTVAVTILDGVWPGLEWIGAHAVMLRASAAIGWWQLAAAAVGVLIILAPRGLLIRWLGLFWMLPLIALRPESVDSGAYRVTVLDVGHGLSVVVETAEHVLVYDTGPRLGASLDAAALAVLPYLAERGHDTVDRVVLSHGDADHVGGYPRLAGSVAVAELIANGTVRSHRPDFECAAGRRWVWDGVSFEILYPFSGNPGFDNAHSCVVRIAGSGGSILLTGDIERPGERALVARLRDRLAADVLVVPHHGSATSSTRRFIEAVSPEIALFSTAERGRFRLPHPAVVSRYENWGVETYSTARCGAVTVEFAATRSLRTMRFEREVEPRYWHARGVSCRAGAAPSPQGSRAGSTVPLRRASD